MHRRSTCSDEACLHDEENDPRREQDGMNMHDSRTRERDQRPRGSTRSAGEWLKVVGICKPGKHDGQDGDGHAREEPAFGGCFLSVDGYRHARSPPVRMLPAMTPGRE